MKNTYIAILISGSFCLISPALVFSEAPAPPRENNKENIPPAVKRDHIPEEMFKNWDANNDGKVSKEEFTKSAEERYDKFNRNKDGALDKKDVPEKIQERMKEKGLHPKDKLNGDKKITKEEFLNMNAKRFEKIDTNNDGFIDKSEFEADVKKMHEHRGHPPQGGPKKPIK